MQASPQPATFAGSSGQGGGAGPSSGGAGSAGGTMAGPDADPIGVGGRGGAGAGGASGAATAGTEGAAGSAGAAGTAGAAGSAGEGAAGSSGSPAPKPRCKSSPDQVIVIGDSYINWVTHTFPDDLAREAGETWRMYAVGGCSLGSGGLCLVPDQLDHFIDLVPVFEGHSDWFADDGIHENSLGSAAMAKEVVRVAEERCIAQPADSGCCEP